MNLSFLPYLVDPATGECLELFVEKRNGDSIIEGMLSSTSNKYPIVRGIPRFSGYQDKANYTNSFGYQWNKWSKLQFESENIGKPMEGHTRGMWERITGIDSKRLEGVFAEFGCGSGRFLEVVRMKQGKVIGIDLSDAVEAAGEAFQDDPEVLICQADVLQPPIKPGSLEGAFSIGVLHHTPNPEKGFGKMVRCVRPGGWAAVCVYGKGGYYDFPTVSLYRNLFKFLWPVFKHYPPLIYSNFATYFLRPISSIPFLGKGVKGLFPYIQLKDINWSLLDTFDSVTPSYQSAHESFEVFQWFKKNSLINIEPSDWGFTAFHAVKPSGAKN